MTPSITRAFSAEEFLRFCREKPAGRSYNAVDSKSCALAQFGFPLIGLSDIDRIGVPVEIYDKIFGGPWTFGALADRLEKVISK